MKTYTPFKVIVTVFLFALLASSCEKDITIDLPDVEQKFVVEGWIENGQVANVILSRNSSYFDPINENTLTSMFDVDATMTVKEVETGLQETLTKTLNPNFFPPVLFRGSSIFGKLNYHYELTIVADGKTFTATTSIPDTLSLDSSWYEAEPEFDSLGTLWLRYQDPQELGDCYRIFTKIKSKDPRFVAVLGSVADDSFFNGQLFSLSFFHGTDNYAATVDNGDDFSPEDYFFKEGDTIITRFTKIDQAHFEFWKSFENAVNSSGNPFATPVTMATNISGGALGVWGGYAAVYDTLVAVEVP